MAMPTIHALENWFVDQATQMSTEKVRWKIYRGNPQKNGDAGSGEASGAEEAWQKLSGYLDAEEWEPGEFVTIRLYTDNAKSKFSDTVFRPIPKNPYRGSASGIAGIGAVGGGYSEAYIAEKVTKELEVYDLRRQVQDLHDALEAKQNIFDRMLTTITEHPNFDPNAIVNGIGHIISNLMPKRAQVGVMGFAQQQQPAGDETQQANRIAAALERLQAQFPEYPLPILLEGLANYVEANPTMAKTLIKNIIQ